jgi:hypothetical protein
MRSIVARHRLQPAPIGRAIAQAVSRPGFEPRSGYVGFMVGRVALGQVFSEEFSFHRLLLNHHHHLSSGAGTICQLVADVPSELSLTPPQENKKKHLPALIKYVEFETLIGVVMKCSISWDITGCRMMGLRTVELYLYSPIRIHGVMLN